MSLTCLNSDSCKNYNVLASRLDQICNIDSNAATKVQHVKLLVYFIIAKYEKYSLKWKMPRTKEEF